MCRSKTYNQRGLFTLVGFFIQDHIMRYDDTWRKYRGRQIQGPENQRIKGSRIFCYDVTVGDIKRLLKGIPGIKKIHIIGPQQVEIIHTFIKANHCRLWFKLKDSGIRIT
jgi:hypothetical protein